ncbi:hypothetical protein QQX98_004442 [Neonectria punicea]|uniref:Zn(2)-C6 fungal-type domain-containing protein n=1 Tax=Neonectria punicea TaxID=979145 RepID=A0ABR1H912_9HYPO
MSDLPATTRPQSGDASAPLRLRALMEREPEEHQPVREPNPEDAVQDDAGGHSSKKRKRATTTDFTRRKRAVAACQFCRLRKTKCDNVRPCCGYCVRHKAKCVYGDSEWLEDSIDNSEQDEGMGRQILKQLEMIKQMLEKNQSSPLQSNPSINSPATFSVTTAANILQNSTSPNVSGLSPWTEATDSVSRTTSTKANSPSPVSRPHALARCESLLRWPIFNGIVSEEDAKVESFLMDSDYKTRKQDTEGSIRNTTQEHVGRGIRDDAFVPLCRKFLNHVHPRNPVLDADELMRLARVAEEHGVRWDSESCLVLVVCALAAYTVPWAPPLDHVDEEDMQLLMKNQMDNRSESEAYYLAAKKRFGLLGHSIQDIQCLFLASMYDKYCLQPLQAWFHLREASVRLHAHLLGQRQHLGNPGSAVSSQHLEQRVFWSCWRAENELLLEAGLPTSGLEHLSYPDAFPAPPPDLASSQHGATSPESIGTPQDKQRLVDEKGWCYYLAEISLRRAIDETVQVLYQRGDYFWLQNQAYLVRHYHEFEQQISLWHHHLPAAVQFQVDQPSDNEFSYFLYGRFSEWRELVLRPIVYHVLHSPSDSVHSDTVHHAQKAVDLCAALILKHSSLMRHGGSWFFARKTFLAACIVLAVVLQPNRGLQPPANWKTLLQSSLQTLRFWERDAPDIRKMRIILDSMYHAVHQRTGY